MNYSDRHYKRIWPLLQMIFRGYVTRKFNMTFEELNVDGPVLLIPNHVTSWDPRLVGMSIRKKQTYYVASEHLFRKGFRSELLKWVAGPIPITKGSVSTDTVRICLRHLKAGNSICIFAEGEQSWDGRNHKVHESTGKLAKLSGATLVTYRIEGGYLSKPRWADTIRTGRIHGHPVGIYSPEELKSKSPAEIQEIINRDISENAWERQLEDPVEYKGERLAEGLERTLYLCPVCRKTGTLRTSGDRISCSCGLNIRYRTDGFFEPDTPFRDIADWEDWQKQALRSGKFEHGAELFSDEGISLKKVGDDHTDIPIEEGRIIQYPDRLVLGDHSFPLDEIDYMAMTRTHILLFSTGGTYYQFSSEPGVNFRKYLEIWKAQSKEQ